MELGLKIKMFNPFECGYRDSSILPNEIFGILYSVCMITVVLHNIRHFAIIFVLIIELYKLDQQTPLLFKMSIKLT